MKYLRASGRPGMAWEIETAYGLESLRDDPTFTYTFKFAKNNVLRAELALEAQAYEWAWLNASDALSVLKWLAELQDRLAAVATRIVAEAEENIAPERVDEMREQQEKVEVAHNSLSELRFSQHVAQEWLWAWRRILSVDRLPRIKDRPY